MNILNKSLKQRHGEVWLREVGLYPANLSADCGVISLHYENGLFGLAEEIEFVTDVVYFLTGALKV